MNHCKYDYIYRCQNIAKDTDFRYVIERYQLKNYYQDKKPLEIDFIIREYCNEEDVLCGNVECYSAEVNDPFDNKLQNKIFELFVVIEHEKKSVVMGPSDLLMKDKFFEHGLPIREYRSYGIASLVMEKLVTTIKEKVLDYSFSFDGSTYDANENMLGEDNKKRKYRLYDNYGIFKKNIVSELTIPTQSSARDNRKLLFTKKHPIQLEKYGVGYKNIIPIFLKTGFNYDAYFTFKIHDEELTLCFRIEINENENYPELMIVVYPICLNSGMSSHYFDNTKQQVLTGLKASLDYYDKNVKLEPAGTQTFMIRNFDNINFQGRGIFSFLGFYINKLIKQYAQDDFTIYYKNIDTRMFNENPFVFDKGNPNAQEDNVNRRDKVFSKLGWRYESNEMGKQLIDNIVANLHLKPLDEFKNIFSADGFLKLDTFRQIRESNFLLQKDTLKKQIESSEQQCNKLLEPCQKFEIFKEKLHNVLRKFFIYCIYATILYIAYITAN